MRNWKLFFVLLITCLMTACGFHLRGTGSFGTLPSELRSLYLTSDRPYTEFMRLLRNSLIQQKASLATSRNTAPYTLRISGESLTTQQTSISSTQQTRQYTVTFSIDYSLITKNGKVILTPSDISASQNLTMYSDELITNTPQLSQLKRVLEYQVINRLYNRLNAKNSLKAIKQGHPYTNENQSRRSTKTP